MTDVRWKQRFDNYVKTWRLLQEICIIEGKPTARDLLAMVQAFKMLSELGWKVMRDYLKHHALSNNSRPFEIIRQSFNEGFITEFIRFICFRAVKQRQPTRPHRPPRQSFL